MRQADVHRLLELAEDPSLPLVSDRGVLWRSADALASLPSTEHIDQHPNSVLDQFNSQFLGYQYAMRIEQWSVFFSGLMPTQDARRLCGHWLAWPGAWMSIEERLAVGKYYYASVPRDAGAPWGQYEGSYAPGMTFRLSDHLNNETFLYPDGWEYVTALVGDGYLRILRVLREAGELKGERS